jgi:hypothetical protein
LGVPFLFCQGQSLQQQKGWYPAPTIFPDFHPLGKRRKSGKMSSASSLTLPKPFQKKRHI